MLTCHGRRAQVAAVGCVLVMFMTANTGCLSDFRERSFPLDPSASVQLATTGVPAPARSTREWLRRAHQQLAGLLPETRRPLLLTEQMVCPDGRPADVFAHFGIDPAGLQTLLKNFRGLRYTAQAASRDYYIDRQAPQWPGFQDVWIPIDLPLPDRELQLCGRLGWARDARGEIMDAACIVILPGLFGDHGVQRSKDLAVPLREAGYHVLHLEVRGHGQTERRYPKMYHSFGVVETDDLMQVSDWLEQFPHVRRTGLVGYCWNANIALYAAWNDGRPADDLDVAPALRPYQISYNPQRRRYRAGVIAFSPVVRWEVLLDELDRDRSRWKHPIFAAIQDTVRDRMKLKCHPEYSGNLRRLIRYEYLGYNVPVPREDLEGYSYLRLLPYRDERVGRKLEFARVPVLIVAGADDPLVPAQDIADLMATIDNPLVAGLIFPTGGHVGYGGFAPRYYFSLIRNFFDPVVGPTAAAAQAVAR